MESRTRLLSRSSPFSVRCVNDKRNTHNSSERRFSASVAVNQRSDDWYPRLKRRRLGPFWPSRRGCLSIASWSRFMGRRKWPVGRKYVSLLSCAYRDMHRLRAQLLLGTLLSAHIALFSASVASTPFCCDASTNCPMHKTAKNAPFKISCLGENGLSRICICAAGNHFSSMLRMGSFLVLRTPKDEARVASVGREVTWFRPRPAAHGFAIPIELPPRY